MSLQAEVRLTIVIDSLSSRHIMTQSDSPKKEEMPGLQKPHLPRTLWNFGMRELRDPEQSPEALAPGGSISNRP